MKHLLRLTLLAAVPSVAQALSAQTPADTLRWNYADCVAHAREHNIELKQTRLAGESAEYSLEAARARWTPTLDFATTHSLTNSPWGEGDKNSYGSSYGLNASWTLYDGGERAATIKREKAGVESAGLNTLAAMRNIDTEILSIYINLLYSREAIAVNRSLAEVSRAQEERGKTLMESGRLALPDYARLQAQAEADRYNVVSAEASYATQRMQLKRVLELGLNTVIEIEPVEFADTDVTDPLPDIDESFRMALDEDAALRAAKVRSQMAELDVAVARASGLPSISLQAGVGSGYYTDRTGGWSNQMKRGLNEQIGVTLAVPIFNQKSTKTAVAKAKVTQIDSQLEADSREDEISQTLEGWYIDMESARSRYEAGLSQLEAASLSSELLNRKFEVGYVEITELLQAHSTLASARHELLQAKYMAVLARKMVQYMRTSSVII